MNSILNEIIEPKTWERFLNYKCNNNLLTRKEKEYMTEYIEKQRYKKIANEILNKNYQFSYPIKHCINKIGNNKKRIIYTFNEDEMMILKVLSFLLLEKYNSQFSPNCYSFRKNYSVKNAIKTIINTPDIENMYGYKIDIHNYFNSIDINDLLYVLKKFLMEKEDFDEEIYIFLESILSNNKVNYNDMIIEEEKGIMAGVPISSFLANVYLTDIDRLFYKTKSAVYARYSDDIIMFCNKEDFNENVKMLEDQIYAKKLILNNDKKEIINPGDMWSFLGFKYFNGNVDVSNIAIRKIKGKIKRSAKKLRSWMLKKEASEDRAIRAMIRKFNKKFYDATEESEELNWSRWYFPIITTTKGLKEIDLYMQQWLRYIATGKHNKKNYEKIKYKQLKEWGYMPLVNSYWKYKKEKVYASEKNNGKVSVQN